jgi:hypothetical protein
MRSMRRAISPCSTRTRPNPYTFWGILGKNYTLTPSPGCGTLQREAQPTKGILFSSLFPPSLSRRALQRRVRWRRLMLPTTLPDPDLLLGPTGGNV